jgi:hypothetical protein
MQREPGEDETPLASTGAAEDGGEAMPAPAPMRGAPASGTGGLY